jgi:hypothetical protein
MFFNLQDCKVHGGQIDVGQPDSDYVYGSGSISWVNNSFENVGINLEPTYYPYGLDDQGLNVDMTFVATNNLFKGGNWFILEPIPASGGNWVFENNLFDKVDILQDTNMPLNYDYNGYWPLTASELVWGGDAGQLQPSTSSSGTHEVVLPAVPPYQAGPFGHFYLPTNTLLYGAGSDTPANLGFFHYTTRLDQVKEGNEPAPHNINIGVHYIAATNGVPIDTDGDGIPDYVENWHGDGARNHADETDWQNPTTATDPTTGNPIPDA